MKHTNIFPVFSIFIDYDRDFEGFDTKYVKNKLKRLPTVFKPDSIFIRKSTGGNTHLKFTYTRKITPLEQLFIRATMRDDPYRLSGDLERLMNDNPRFGLIFCEKRYITEDKILLASEWQELKYEGIYVYAY